MLNTPEAIAFRARLDAWRARGPAGQRDYFLEGRPDAKARLAAVASCPDRGGVLPISMQPEGCTRCGEKSECRAGRGEVPGRVSLRECLDCRSGV